MNPERPGRRLFPDLTDPTAYQVDMAIWDAAEMANAVDASLKAMPKEKEFLEPLARLLERIARRT